MPGLFVWRTETLLTGALAPVSYWIAAGSYAALAGLVFLFSAGAVRWLLAMAASVTALWAAAIAFSLENQPAYAGIALNIGETIRSGAWLFFIAVIMRRGWEDSASDPSRKVVSAAVIIVAVQLALDTLIVGGIGSVEFFRFLSGFGRVALAVGGLVLTHNLLVNSAPANRWSLNLLIVGLAGLFAYDLNLYTLRLLDPDLAGDFFEVRGIADAILAPLFLLSVLRNRDLKLQLSRQAAFQTFSLGAIGLYLVLMSLAAYALGLVGGDWGRLFQIVLVFGGLVFAAIIVFSGRVRAWLRVKVNKHFLSYRYDYRAEWLQFIAKVSRTGPGFGELPARVIEAIAGIVDSPGGALYVRGDDAVFEPAGKWNFRSHAMQPLTLPAEMVAALAKDGRIIDLTEARRHGAPESLLEGNARLLVPLAHVDELIAVAVLEQPLARRDFDWEDFDILRTVGRQGASYIAEARALADLEESRKFEEFNRRFAFIMHDIKNVVSQLSLLARNAERHADNQDFRADMVATLTSSVGKMNEMLARLSQESSPETSAHRFDLHAMLAEIVEQKRRSGAAIEFDADGYVLEIMGDRDKLEQAVTHIVQNAVDASADGTAVCIRLRNEAGSAKIIVEDRGAGMSEAFIREELFKPFRSTKSGGFGIGAYEAREIIRAQGGSLTVNSEEGSGTRFVVGLSAGAKPSDQERK